MYPLLAQLNEEWRILDATSDPAVRSWAADAPGLVAEHLADLLPWIAADPDPALRWLLIRAQDGDRLAGRTVLQTMLGKLVLLSVSATRPGLTQQDAFGDLVAQLWVVALDYPTDRRPAKVAANLWMDTLKLARRQWTATAGPALEVSYSPRDVVWLAEHELAHPTPHSEDAELGADQIIEAARRHGLISRDVANLLLAVYGPHGLSGALAAHEWCISPAAVRTRCRRAISAIRQAHHLTAA